MPLTDLAIVFNVRLFAAAELALLRAAKEEALLELFDELLSHVDDVPRWRARVLCGVVAAPLDA